MTMDILSLRELVREGEFEKSEEIGLLGEWITNGGGCVRAMPAWIRRRGCG